MLTSVLTVHMLKSIVRGHVCCPLIHYSLFIYLQRSTKLVLKIDVILCSPQKTVHLLLVIFFIHFIRIHFNTSLLIDGVFFKVERLHKPADIDPLPAKVISP